ncbi:MAG: Flp pilus assembly complex ATPase component TadA [Burkholderiales bacterium]|nr:Flp pilus assembly complex ATPase component TadA [Burkholderiales bacterium]
MKEQLRDALRHLEKDMADIMDVLVDKCTTEIILNPQRKPDGSYTGYILVDQQGRGLHNLVRYSEHDFSVLGLTVGDLVVYKSLVEKNASYIERHKTFRIMGNISAATAIKDNCPLFWVKLSTTDMHYNLVQIALCLKSYFGEDKIYQTDDFMLLEYAQIIEEHDIDDWVVKYNSENLSSGKLGNNVFIDRQLLQQKPLEVIQQLIQWVNHNLPSHIPFKLVYTVVNSVNNEGINFIPYPQKLVKADLVKMSSSRAETIMSVLASMTGKFIHQKSPYLECQIPYYGHRFTGVIPPVVAYPAFCIRKHAPQIFTLDDLVVQGVLQQSSKDTILSWISRKFNILLAGGTGSGKTTLANAILHEINQLFPETRILIIEDVPELKFNTSRSIGFTVGEFFSMYEALRTTLRFKPDRIVMGEVRGSEAYTLLKAWNTGHPGGIATIHANGVNEALYRFESCIRDHPEATVNRQEIGFTINGIISIQNVTLKEIVNGEFMNVVRRKVTALRQILQYDPDKNVYQDVVYDQEHFI